MLMVLVLAMTMAMVVVMVRKKLLVIPGAYGLGRVRLLPHVHGGARARGGAGHQVTMLIKLVLLIMHQFDHVGQIICFD